jgi:hypothetical protein
MDEDIPFNNKDQKSMTIENFFIKDINLNTKNTKNIIDR